MATHMHQFDTDAAAAYCFIHRKTRQNRDRLEKFNNVIAS